MKKHIFNSLLLLFSAACISSCDYMDTRPSANLSGDEVFNDITRGQQFLYYGYRDLPTRPQIAYDYYSDNAIRNDATYEQLNSGWTSETSPNSGFWSSALAKINHLNQYFRDGFNNDYDRQDKENSLQLIKRMKGEAFGLRAYYRWILLKNYAGPDEQGNFLSYPLFDDVLDVEHAPNIARASYKDGFKAIMDDIDSAYVHIEFMRYNGSKTWNSAKNTGRIDREMLLALKARVYLFAASPAFKQVTWAEAAQAAYDAINEIDNGQLKDLKAYNSRFNDADNIDDFWRSSYGSSGDLEGTYYPPSMWGSGQCNPTQGLVDAFGDANGMPISESQSYDSSDPYKNRDPRLTRYLFVNGQNDFRSAFVEAYEGGRDVCGGDRLYGTKTGYFMKRFLSTNVDKTPRTNKSTSDYKFCVFFERAKLYLDFAEAAIEAYGTEGKLPEWNFSAIDALEKIRKHGGIVDDQYLRPIAAKDIEKLRALVRNERRLETCFEGERMYDRLRWQLPINEMSKERMGMTIERTGDDSYTFTPKVIDQPKFYERMYYFPIPRTQVLKSKALKQNRGWE